MINAPASTSKPEIKTSPIQAAIGRVKSTLSRLSFSRSYLLVFYFTALPIGVLHEMLWYIWQGGLPRAWDGTGHYGIGQIYNAGIFPDTFGWTHAYFGGMPFPNFYPPLFFWCASLLNHAHLCSYETAFKVMVLLPTLLIPGTMWVLAWSLSDRRHVVAYSAAFTSLFPLLDPRFGGHLQWSSGLDYSSTFGIGMYTQPLGFVLLLAWYITYRHAHRQVWRFLLATLLLALAVLGNYLNGVTTVIIISSTLLIDLIKYRKAVVTSRKSDEARRALIAHTLSPVLALGLTLFWLIPMLTQYKYFVTRPFTWVIISPFMVAWFILAFFGMLNWVRHPTSATWPYIISCVVLFSVVLLAATFAPPWFPLQANRLTPTLNFLLAVPVGYTALQLYEWLTALLSPRLNRVPLAVRLKPYALAAFLAFPLVMMYGLSYERRTKLYTVIEANLAVYPPVDSALPEGAAPVPTPFPEDLRIPANFSEDKLDLWEEQHKNDYTATGYAAQNLKAILQFAQVHRDGRYLVEVPNLFVGSAGYDGRALNSYLGAQGNQTISVVFREASPSSLFTNPLVNVFSYNPENFGISSVLGDDLNFAEQPLALHLKRARFLSTRYLVIYSPSIKERVAREPDIVAHWDYGYWTIFDIGTPAPQAEVLPYRPALLVSNFTVKQRRPDDYNFIRLAEEQFADGWFDVLLARAPDTQLENLVGREDFYKYGAVILDTYDCIQCDQVFRYLRLYSQQRALILLARDAPLFQRIRYNLNDFPLAKIIERDPQAHEPWLANWGPNHRYQTSQIRKVWSSIREFLDQHKVPTAGPGLTADIQQNKILLKLGAPVAEEVPVLIRTSHHPAWQRTDGREVYSINPMYMMTFMNQEITLEYSRRWFDWVGLLISILVLLGLLFFAGRNYLPWFKRSGEPRPLIK
jgi:hypothetical protein